MANPPTWTEEADRLDALVRLPGRRAPGDQAVVPQRGSTMSGALTVPLAAAVNGRGVAPVSWTVMPHPAAMAAVER